MYRYFLSEKIDSCASHFHRNSACRRPSDIPEWNHPDVVLRKTSSSFFPEDLLSFSAFIQFREIVFY